MKKGIIIAAATAMLSCTADVTTQQPVTFGYAMVESGSMTRVDAEDIRGIITSMLPQSVELKLTDGKGNAYTATTGESVTLPLGDYSVTYSYRGYSIGQLMGTSVYLTAAPTFSISDNVSVTYDGGDKTLHAQYTCTALVLDYSECTALEYYDLSASAWKGVPLTGDGYGVVFIYGDSGNRTFRLRAVTSAEGYRSNELTATTGSADGAVTLKTGKYYVIHPEEITEAEGEMGVQFGTFSAGEEL